MQKTFDLDKAVAGGAMKNLVNQDIFTALNYNWARYDPSLGADAVPDELSYKLLIT